MMSERRRPGTDLVIAVVVVAVALPTMYAVMLSVPDIDTTTRIVKTSVIAVVTVCGIWTMIDPVVSFLRSREEERPSR